MVLPAPGELQAPGRGFFPGTLELLPAHPPSLAATGNTQPPTAEEHGNKCPGVLLLQPLLLLQAGGTSLRVFSANGQILHPLSPRAQFCSFEDSRPVGCSWE